LRTPPHKPRAALEGRNFYPPPNYVDQTALSQLCGEKTKYPECLNCGKLRGPGHHHFDDCREPCLHCGDHNGTRICPRLWCSERWWSSRIGRRPFGVKFRPSEAQREVLARSDPYFINFPEPIQPQAYMDAEPQGKRKAAEAGLDVNADRFKRRHVAGEDETRRVAQDMAQRLAEESIAKAKAETEQQRLSRQVTTMRRELEKKRGGEAEQLRLRRELESKRGVEAELERTRAALAEARAARPEAHRPAGFGFENGVAVKVKVEEKSNADVKINVEEASGEDVKIKAEDDESEAEAEQTKIEESAEQAINPADELKKEETD
jgi:hypothetical protein